MINKVIAFVNDSERNSEDNFITSLVFEIMWNLKIIDEYFKMSIIIISYVKTKYNYQSLFLFI